MRFEELSGRRVVIWGIGREGQAAHAELERRGIPAQFAVTGDVAAIGDLAEFTAVGSAATERLESADVVIKSPGVPRSSVEFLRLRELGIPVTSLTDLWLSANAARVLAVTGTKGKSTTSALVQHLLGSIGITATLVGNGGTPVTDGDTIDADVAVAEISSYQAADLSVSPRSAVVTSLYPEHLPWHGGFDQYVKDKLNLIAHGCELIVIPDPVGDLADRVRAHAVETSATVAPNALGLAVSGSGIHWDGVGRLTPGDLRVKGFHNLTNVALALTAVTIGFEVDSVGKGRLLASARTFLPLSHRLETVPSDDGRLWVDDGLATAPEAVVAALETYPNSRVLLILGGADRGLSFGPLGRYLETRASAAYVDIIAVGPAGVRWMAEWPRAAISSRLAGSFAEALKWVREDPARSDVVLLSPAAPSFDEFASFEARSAAFRLAANVATAEQIGSA